MRKLVLSSRFCEFAVLGSVILFLHIRPVVPRNKYHLYDKFVPDLKELEQFDTKIAINLTQAFFGSKLLPIGSEIRHFVQTYLVDFYQSTGFSQIQDVIGREQLGASKNPICAYKLIRRSFLLLKNIITHRHFLLKFGVLRRDNIYFYWRNGWPFFKNTKLATDKILELQNVYNLEAEKFSTGSILKRRTNCSLSSTHCYEIGHSAFKTDQFDLALEWLVLAKEKAVVDKMTSIALIELLIWRATHDHLPTPIMEVIDTEKHPPPPKFPLENPHKLSKYSYMSPRALSLFVKFEWSIYPQIKHLYTKYRNLTQGTFREAFDRQNKDVKMYLEEFEKFTITLIGDLESTKNPDIKTVEKVALNLLASFKMVTRFMDYIQPWVQRKSRADNKLMTIITSYLTKVYNITDGPTGIDFESAMFGVYNIQLTHSLDIKDIANGIVAGRDTKMTLNARDCLNIATFSKIFSDHTNALKWAEHALYLNRNEADDSVKYEEVYDYFSAFQMDYDCTIQPENPICHGNAKSKLMDGVNRSRHGEVMFRTMCKGKSFQTIKEKAVLFCWYESEIHASYKIGPIKAEWLSMRPKAEVVYFYDIMSNTIMNSLINFTYDNEFRGLYKGDGEPVVQSLEHQVMNGSVDLLNEAAIYTLKLTERLTALKIVNKTNGPLLRMTGYPPGSFRGVHHDTKTNLHLASLLFYFNDVQAGGETPFTDAGVTAIPRKGSAVFWYNLFTDGNVDNSSYHGGCPVIMGEKWVSMRWFLYIMQDQLKCDLKPQTPFEYLVNGKSKYL